jgi:hypothetical protein
MFWFHRGDGRKAVPGRLGQCLVDVCGDLIRAQAGSVVEYLRDEHQFIGAGADV